MKAFKLVSIVVLAFILGLVLTKFHHPETKDNEQFTVDQDYDRLFDNDVKHRIVIEISSEEFQGMSDDMLDFSRIDDRMRTGNYREAKITYYDEYGQISVDKIGIRTKGNTSRVLPIEDGEYNRSHFKLKFNETFEYEEGTSEYEVLNAQKMFGVSELILKSTMDYDSSYTHEIYAYNLQKEIGLKAPSATLTTLEFVIDGETIKYGVYIAIEAIDKNFLTRHYSKAYDDGDLYKCLWQDFGPAILAPLYSPLQVGIKSWEENYRPTYDLKTNKDSSEHEDFYSFIKNINDLKGDEYVQYMNENFEVDNYLKSTIVNVFLGNPDDYWAMGNNYYLYFNPKGKAEFIQIDYDNSMGSGWNGWGYSSVRTASAFEWHDLIHDFINFNHQRPLIEKMLEFEEYRDKYKLYLASINEIYSYEHFLSYYNNFKEMYSEDTIANYPFSLTTEQDFFKYRKQAIEKDLQVSE